MEHEWRARCSQKSLHLAIIRQGKDEIPTPPSTLKLIKPAVVWKGLALMVPTRLWLAGVVSATRDRALTDRLMGQMRACAQWLYARLLCTDGWAAYPGSIRRAFREKVKTAAGRGRPRTRLIPDPVRPKRPRGRSRKVLSWASIG